jgi:hypothetical protein
MFPYDTDQFRAEALIDGTWTDITTSVRSVGDVATISRGRPDEQSRVRTERCALRINNRDGVYSNRNPNSVYFGLLGRNTQVRLSVAPVIGALADYGTDSASHVAPSVTLDGSAGLLICVWAALDDSFTTIDYTVPGSMTAGTELDEFSTTRSGRQALAAAGATGTRTATASSATEWWHAVSVALPGPSITVQEVLQDSNNGADVTLTTGSGTQAGWVMVAVQTWDIESGNMTSPPSGSGWSALADTGSNPRGRTRAWFNTTRTAGAQAVTFIQNPNGTTDNHAHLFVLSGVEALPPQLAYRFWGEVPAWPQVWDKSGRDVFVPIEVNGIFRRLDRPTAPLRSALFREATSAASLPLLRAYWPLEDGTDASIYASGIGHDAMSHSGEAPSVGSTDFFFGSAPVLQLGATTRLVGDIRPHATTGTIAFRGLFAFPEAAFTTNTTLLEIQQTGSSSIAAWRLVYTTTSGGSVTVQGINAAGTVAVTSGEIVFGFSDVQELIGVQLATSGSDVSWGIFGRRVNADGSVVEGGFDGTFSSVSVGRATRLVVAPNGGLTDLGVGHLMVGTSTSLAATVDDAIVGHIGETAAERIERLCGEEGITFELVGDGSASPAMGPQGINTLANLLYEARDADGGILFEPRYAFGVAFRPHSDLENQTSTATLDYAATHILDIRPTDDDQYLVNDYTASRTDGSSSRSVVDTGPLSTQDPPDGVGAYPGAGTFNVQFDAQLDDLASWRTHLGTWDEARYPVLAAELARSEFAANLGLAASLLALDLGDRLVVENPPAWLPPDDIDTQVQGYTERIYRSTGTGLTLSWVTSPAGPYRVGELADTTADANEYAARECGDEAAAIRTAIDDNDVSVDVDPNRYRWTTVADDFDPDLDIRLGGEVVSVSNITTTAGTYVAAGAASHADNAAVTPALYAGATARDGIFILAAIRSSGTGTLETPTGYTRLEIQGWDTTTNVALFHKVHSGSESNPTVTPSGGSAGDTVSAFTFGLRGTPCTLVAPGDIVVDSLAQLNGSAANIAYPGLYTRNQEGCINLLVAWKQDDYTSVAPPSGFTEALEASTTTGSDQSLYLAYRIDTTPAVIDEGSLVVTGGASAISRAAVVAIAAGYQTFTISARSVNGVTKSHSAGTRIEAEDAFVLAL